MGLLGFIFDNLLGSSQKPKANDLSQSNTLFITSEQIRKTLYNIKSLDRAQREVVEKLLRKYLGDGKVTRNEFKIYILPALYKLRKENVLSEIDYENLKSLLY